MVVGARVVAVGMGALDASGALEDLDDLRGCAETREILRADGLEIDEVDLSARSPGRDLERAWVGGRRRWKTRATSRGGGDAGSGTGLLSSTSSWTTSSVDTSSTSSV